MALMESAKSGTKRIRESGRSCICRGWSQCAAGWSEPSVGSVKSPASGSTPGWTGTWRDFNHVNSCNCLISTENGNRKSEVSLINHKVHKRDGEMWLWLTVWGQPGWPPGHTHFLWLVSPRSAPTWTDFLDYICGRRDHIQNAVSMHGITSPQT